MAQAVAAAAVAAIKFVKAAAALIGAELTTAQAAAIINAVTAAVAQAGVNAYLSSQREFPNQGRALRLGIRPDLPRRWQIGRRGNAGILTDWHVNGHKNQFLWLVKYLGEGPMAPINKIFADGRQVWSGTLNHGQSVRLTEFDSPDERARVHFFDGRVGQTAPQTLINEGFVSSTYRGTGMAYVILQLHWDPDTTPVPPDMVYVSDGAMLYDRRQSGQSLTDPSTWTLSNNPAVAADHYCLGNYWPGLAKPRLGIGLDPADVPYDKFNSNASIADELVALVLGSQTRYVANGFIEADQVHATILTELYKAMDCRPADFGGSVSALSHAPKSSIMTITDDDLILTGVEVYEPKRSWGTLVGAVEGTYQDEANNFQPAPYPDVADSAWETEDGGKTTRKTFNLPFNTDPSRAQRLARLFALRERRQATLTGQYAPRVIELEEGDWFTRQTGANGRFPAGKVFEVVEPPQLNPNTMEVTLSALEVDPSDSAWTSTDATDVTPPTGDTNNSRPALPVPVVTLGVYAASFGLYAFSNVVFNHTEFADIPLSVEIEIDESDGAGAPAGNNRAFTVLIPAGQQYSSSVNQCLPGRTYVARVRSFTSSRSSAWSGWSEFTADNSAQYGPIGGDATLGSNVYREDGTTLINDADAITGLGIAAGFTGSGSLAYLSSISSANANAWNLLRRNTGGLFTGDLTADTTGSNIAAGFTGSGSLAYLSSISSTNANAWNLLRRSSGGLFTGDLAADITSGNIAAGFTGQGGLATLSQVDTPEIADNAVSDGDEDTQLNYDFTAIDNTFVTLCTLAPQNVGGVAILSWDQSWVMSAFGGGTANTEIGTVDTEIRRDGVMIFENSEPYTNRNTGTFGDSGGWTDSDFDLVVDTNAVYTLAVRVSVTSAWSPGNPSIESRSVSATLKATAFAK